MSLTITTGLVTTSMLVTIIPEFETNYIVYDFHTAEIAFRNFRNFLKRSAVFILFIITWKIITGQINQPQFRHSPTLKIQLQFS